MNGAVLSERVARHDCPVSSVAKSAKIVLWVRACNAPVGAVGVAEVHAWIPKRRSVVSEELQ